jgi:hypothetical protein
MNRFEDSISKERSPETTKKIGEHPLDTISSEISRNNADGIEKRIENNKVSNFKLNLKAYEGGEVP